jgi:hypothetical protein
MNIDQINFYQIWQKLAFQVIHKTTIWALLLFFLTAGASWHLGNLLNKHNAREREAKLAHRTAIVYIAAAIAFWLFSTIMS